MKRERRKNRRLAALDELGASNRWLAIGFVFSLLLSVCGALLEGFQGSALTFTGGATFAFVLASWQIHSDSRTREQARDRFWKSASKDAIICLPLRLPERANGDGDQSSYTPFHDWVAGQTVQQFLRDEFERDVPMEASADFGNLDEIRQKSIILIGGPNLNKLTADAMDEIFGQSRTGLFHWKSTVSPHLDEASGLKDMFLKLIESDDKLYIDERVQDLLDDENELRSATGMFLRIGGFGAGNKQLTIIAGSANALGSLAAAEYAVDMDELTLLRPGTSQVLVRADASGGRLGIIGPLRSI